MHSILAPAKSGKSLDLYLKLLDVAPTARGYTNPKSLRQVAKDHKEHAINFPPLHGDGGKR